MSIIFDVPTVLAEARRRSGLHTLHEAGLGDRLERLVRHMDRDLGLDDAGRQAAIDTLASLVGRRARLFSDRQRYPEIAAEQIRRPIVVTGQARSGTTLLHSLVAADPNNRAPAWWDSLQPSPPPAIAAANDPRLADMNAEMAELVRRQPHLLASHPYFDEGGLALMECEKITVLDLRYLLRTAFFRVPAVLSIRLDDDWEALFRFHQIVLQALQWRMPPKRWALKGTEHHAHLDALKAVYPDAVVIWIHRDPQKVVPSWLEMLARVAEGTTGRPIDRPAFARTTLPRYQANLEAAMANPLVDHPDVHHVRYADFVADPVGRIEAIYRQAALPFDGATRAAMEGWLAANRGDRHGKFTYDIESFDMTPADIEAAMGGYRERFAIPFEGQRA